MNASPHESAATSDAEPTAAAETPWQALPPRARPLFVLDTAISLGVLFGLVAVVSVTVWLGVAAGIAAGATGALLGVALGIWIGSKQFKHCYWRLDAHGLAVRRGRLWQRETRVPITRVQHLDLKHGPWQRRRQLATLVVHTAGTRHSSVNVPHLDAQDAQRLRDRLGRQIDVDDES